MLTNALILNKINDANILYPGVLYFELMHDFPHNPKGSVIGICNADGRQHLWGNKIEFSIDAAVNNEEWFRPVYLEEHQAKVHANLIAYLVEKGCTEEKIELFLTHWYSDD